MSCSLLHLLLQFQIWPEQMSSQSEAHHKGRRTLCRLQIQPRLPSSSRMVSPNGIKEEFKDVRHSDEEGFATRPQQLTNFDESNILTSPPFISPSVLREVNGLSELLLEFSSGSRQDIGGH